MTMLKYKSSMSAGDDYRRAKDPNAAPAHTTKMIEFSAMRNHALSNKWLYFASNMSFSPFAIYRRFDLPTVS